MRIVMAMALMAMGAITGASAADRPMVEQYLHSGKLVAGAQALESELEKNPKNDQIRYGLGVIQFVRGIERLGQGLFEYGAITENSNIPFLRLPIPKNINPAPITYTAFRRLLDDFYRDLDLCDKTLAGIKDDEVKLPIRLADIRFDLDGDGKANDRFLDVLKKFIGRRMDFLKNNPDFLVAFDRGDVAWFRAYCHLLMGGIDLYLAFDTQDIFDLNADSLFANPRVKSNLSAEERSIKQQAMKTLVISEPKRLGRFRKHWVAVADLNVETWKYILAEKDDDHEWLPNPKQKGVLELPIRKEMIDAWLAMMVELKALFEGERTFNFQFLDEYFTKDGKGLHLRTFLDDPPESLDIGSGDLFKSLPDKYYAQKKPIDINVIIAVFNLFSNANGMSYALWFN